MSYDSHWGSVRDTVRLNLRGRLGELGLPEEVSSRISHSGRCNRAVLFLMLANAVAKSERNTGTAVDLAVALEMIHKASVIRDDVADADLIRRGRPTELSVMGIPGALAISDVLLAGGLAMIQRLESAAVKMVLSTLASMARGQFYDVQESLELDDPFSIAELKTGSLIALVFWMGCLHSGRPRRDRKLLHTIGMHLGTAFQLANDINNVTRNEGRGKPQGSDLTEHRNSAIALLVNRQEYELSSVSHSSIGSAVARTYVEIDRRLCEANRLTSLLNFPLPEELRLLLSDEGTARSFVGDQQ